LKIAFVNQPIDTILPPYQNSVGACTYGVACCLSRFCEVIVYGSSHRHKDLPIEFREQNVHFRFFSLPFLDRLAGKARKIYSQVVPLSPPASSSKWFYATFGQRVAEDLRAQACDVIHVQHCSQYLPVIRTSNPNAKIVVQLHAEWFSQNRLAILEQRLRYVDLVTTVSDYITKKTRQQFPMMAARCQTLYNGVDAAEFRRNRSYRSPQRQEKRILYAGAVSPHKGLHVLVDAFSIVVKQYPEVRLDIVGSQQNYPLAEAFEVQERDLIESVYPFYAYDWVSRLEAKLGLVQPDARTYIGNLKERLSAEARGKVAFLGFISRPDLLDLYYDADVFAFAPIWNEGFGIPPVEAMAAGTPVVATRSGAIPEIVKDKKTGFLVDKNDPHALAECILTLLRDDNLRESMGRAGRSWVHENFTWEKSAETMYRCYVDLCENGGLRENVRSPHRVAG
jgi:glycosyltransferase involved in cell wall biosynthesis